MSLTGDHAWEYEWQLIQTSTPNYNGSIEAPRKCLRDIEGSIQKEASSSLKQI